MPSLPSAVPRSVPRDATSPALAIRASLDFHGFYREYFRFVWRTVRRLGIEGVLIDDVVQEVFLVVHRRLGDFEGRSSYKTWLYGIIRRIVADQRRTARRKPAHPADHELDAVKSPSHGPDACAEHAERVRLLHRLLAELDESRREVFILADLEGLTTLEIAEALGSNPNTIGSRIRAARREFEAALGRALPDHDALEPCSEPRRPR
jgi:RNA polymerase sigma-70 factor (ECF subfamily)